mmetsp:Transcript_15795/g.26974  ORF Transcript_15795/g.26974 Transcript_15795/m.26974 type:complete len:162 (-) Transcript_15795:488-973(-)
MLAKAGVVTICVFRSTPQQVKSYSSHATLALSDGKGFVYKTFRLKAKSLGGGFVGLSAEIFGNLKKYGRYISPVASVKDFATGNLKKVAQMPADFLIDEEGKIVDLFRGEKYSDAMHFSRIEAFIPDDKRCKCNKKDCISPRCQKEYENIQKSAADLLFTG